MKLKKGFTLIEVVVVIVLSSVLLAGLVPLLPVAQKQMYRTQNVTTASQAGESIYKYIVDTLNTADRIWIGDNNSNKPSDYQNWNTLTVQSGTLLLNGAFVYDEDYQNSCMLTLSANGLGRTNLELSIELTKVTGSKTEVLYTRNSAFSPAAMSTSAYACIEGSIGSEISTMRYSSDDANPYSGNSELVIYFQQAQNTTIPPFTPNTSPSPDVPPTAEPSALTVTLQSTLELSTNETKSLVPTVTLPQNTDFSTVSYQWSGIGQNSGFSATPQYGENGNITRYEITGVSSTKQRVTLTVSCTANGIEYTQTVSCTIVVSQPESTSPPISSDKFGIYTGDWDAFSSKRSINISGKTILINIDDYPYSSYQVSAFAPQYIADNTPIQGIWKIESALGPDGSSAYVIDEPSSSPSWTLRISPKNEGVVTISFTAIDKDGQGRNIPPELVGLQTQFKIIFYKGENFAANSQMIRLHSYFTNSDATDNKQKLRVPYESTETSFTNYVWGIEVIAQGNTADIIHEKLSEEDIEVAISSYADGNLLDLSQIDIWRSEDGVNAPYAALKPATQTLRWSQADNCYQATFPFYFNATESVAFAWNDHRFPIRVWVYQQNASQSSNKDVWFHPSSMGLNPNAELRVSKPIPATQIYKYENGFTAQKDDGKWVGTYSSNLKNKTVFVDLSQTYTIVHCAPDSLETYFLAGQWSIVNSLNSNGETDNDILTESTKNSLSQEYNPLSLTAQKEGIVVLKHTSNGNTSQKVDWGFNYAGSNSSFQNITAQVTIIFYDAEKVANGTSELLKSSLTLTTNTDETESNSIATAYTTEGKVFAKATFSLDVVPKWNWDESKVNVEEIIRNALESNPPSVSLSTFKTSMTSWSDVSAISKPSNAPLIASSKNGTYQATFPLAFSDYIPTADLTTSLYAWLWTENPTILGGIDTVFNPTLPNRCTVTVTPATPILSTSLIPVPDSLVPFNSSLTVGVGQGLIIYALDDNGQNTLSGTWTITDTKNESRTVTIQDRDTLDLSQIFESSNSSKNFLTEGEYKITYKSDIEPYTNATIVFYVKVKPIPVLVAFTELVSEASQRKHYFNHSSVTATYNETVNLYAFVKNSSTYTQASGYWTIMQDDNGILQDKVEGTVVSGSQLELKFNSQDKTCTVNVRFTSTSNPQDTLDLVISVSPSKLSGITKPVGSNTSGQLENGDFTIGNGKIVLNTKLDLLPEEDKIPSQSKYLRWYVNDTVIFDSYVNSGNTKYVVPSSNGKDLLVFNISDEGKIVTFNGSNGTGSSRTVKLTLKYSSDGKSWSYYDAINITTK